MEERWVEQVRTLPTKFWVLQNYVSSIEVTALDWMSCWTISERVHCAWRWWKAFASWSAMAESASSVYWSAHSESYLWTGMHTRVRVQGEGGSSGSSETCWVPGWGYCVQQFWRCDACSQVSSICTFTILNITQLERQWKKTHVSFQDGVIKPGKTHVHSTGCRSRESVWRHLWYSRFAWGQFEVTPVLACSSVCVS